MLGFWPFGDGGMGNSSASPRLSPPLPVSKDPDRAEQQSSMVTPLALTWGRGQGAQDATCMPITPPWVQQGQARKARRHNKGKSRLPKESQQASETGPPVGTWFPSEEPEPQEIL